MAQINDVVLIYFEDQPASFARVEEIFPDHKKDWFHIRLLLLQVPLQTVTWILKDVYIQGEEFTMNGNRMRIEKVVAPADSQPEAPAPSPKETGASRQSSAEPSESAKVISLQDRK